MTAFEGLADQIVTHSAGPVFGVPGSGATLSLIDALENRNHGFVLTHLEGAAAMMAGTVGRLSGRAGACLSIKGPGVTNMMPGLAVSHFESFPLVALVEAYGAEAPVSKAHKRIDQAALTATVSKAVTQFTENGPSFGDAAALATDEVPGPVIMELAQPAPEAPQSLAAAAAAPAASDGDSVLKLLSSAQRPVVIAGTLAIRCGMSKSLNALKIPVFSTAAAKGVVDEKSPHAAGVYTGVGLELSPEHSLLEEADLIVCLGLRCNEVLATRPFSRKAINIDTIDDPGAQDFEFDAVAGLTIADAVFSELDGKIWGDDLNLSAREKLHKAIFRNTFLPAHVFDSVAAQFADGVRGVFDTGYFCTIAEHCWNASTSDHCLMSGQGRYMGTGVPMAIAASLYDPSVPAVAFLGDGGIGPFIGEAKIAVEHKLPLLFCLLSDGRFASIRTRAIADKLTEQPLTPALPSWIGVMEGFGMPVHSASDEASLSEALNSWSPSEGPAYLEVTFEPDPYEAMVKGIR